MDTNVNVTIHVQLNQEEAKLLEDVLRENHYSEANIKNIVAGFRGKLDVLVKNITGCSCRLTHPKDVHHHACKKHKKR